jgi:hypothetical protein
VVPSALVEPLMAETTAITGRLRRVLSMMAATAFKRSPLPTLVPPNFWTMIPMGGRSLEKCVAQL